MRKMNWTLVQLPKALSKQVREMREADAYSSSTKYNIKGFKRNTENSAMGVQGRQYFAWDLAKSCNQL